MKQQALKPGPSAHNQQKRAAMVETILEAARTIMQEKGVAALAMQELARRLGLRAPSLYYYFASKLDLYDALFRLGWTLYGARLEPVLNEAETWQEFVRRSMDVYLEFAIENPELYQLCFERPVPGFVPSPASMEQSLSLLERAYRRGAALTRDLDTGLSAKQRVDLLIAIMHGITAQHLANEPQLPAGEGRFGALVPEVLRLLEKGWVEGGTSVHGRKRRT